MTMTEPELAAIEGLLAKATPGPWAYRSQEYDDWGLIRTTVELGGWHPVVAVSRGDGEHGLHRAQGTDPYEPNGRLIVAAINALPALLATARSVGEMEERVREECAQIAENLVSGGVDPVMTGRERAFGKRIAKAIRARNALKETT